MVKISPHPPPNSLIKFNLFIYALAREISLSSTPIPNFPLLHSNFLTYSEAFSTIFKLIEYSIRYLIHIILMLFGLKEAELWDKSLNSGFEIIMVYFWDISKTTVSIHKVGLTTQIDGSIEPSRLIWKILALSDRRLGGKIQLFAKVLDIPSSLVLLLLN